MDNEMLNPLMCGVLDTRDTRDTRAVVWRSVFAYMLHRCGG